ncbi:DUF389 domain-containing protein [Sphingomonas sp. Y38-1Y]|uniref:DUF389 domain-containing protein n=1 Tax=Sphingomonas sp. Y38-1Y TaxID=3078265 RepID=UPI0028E3BB7B|nr:DUF389 domain-containing protein [Sphingomonas sp. Y38-1Y]
MTVFARNRASFVAVRRWWAAHLRRGLDHEAVLTQVRDDARWNGRYAFMTLMAAGIAMLGMLLPSPVIVLGAMLISPLMGPIIGLGFGIATFDWREIRAALAALALGIVLAVAFSALIVLFSPLQNATDEIASRTRPNLFDLFVALFSALAGAYAMIHGRHGTVVGVAIATALMPPLCVVGFGLATQNATVLGGAILLFVTNFVTIALSAAVIARLHGFGAHLSPQHTLFQTFLIVALLAALAVPLGVSLRQIAWESIFSRQVREVIAAEFGGAARLSQVDVTYGADRIRVEATVLTPRSNREAERHAAAELRQRAGRPVSVSIDQYRVGTGAEAEAAQIANAAGRLGDRMGQQVAERLALVTGTPREAIMIDVDQRHALARAVPLPGASAAAYRLLEQRVAAGAPGWRIEIVPPLPEPIAIQLNEDVPDPQAVELIAWMAKRTGLPPAIDGATGPGDAVIAALAQAGVMARRGERTTGLLEANWALAD